MVTFEMKVQYFVQKLDVKYKNLKDIFSTGLTKNTETKDYRPRIVVDEDSASEGDMDYN